MAAIIKLYRKNDPRDEPLYPVRDAACYLDLPPSTVRLWASGRERSIAGVGRTFDQPLLTPAQANPLTLSFWNLIELYVLASVRKPREHRLSMQNVRQALEYVQQKLGVDRPLIRKQFYTDGWSLFVRQYTRLINVSRGGQFVIEEAVDAYLKRIERDVQGLASKLFPWMDNPDEPRLLSIDAEHSFGRPTIAGTSIPAEEIAERYNAGDEIEALVADFRLTREQIEAAIRWCGRARAA
jgi:uncharacterized protein (DUF433 family)